MARDGAGIYTKPFASVVDGTTILSVEHNGTIDDIATDLNTVRPIVAGGTGANNAVQAMLNLSGEIANQQVTNYSSFSFKPGSFWSANTTGIGAPVDGHYFSGICYNAATNLVLEATDLSSGGFEKYMRNFNTTTWGPWIPMAPSSATLDAAYVNVNGDTMAGSLVIANSAPTIQLSKSASGGNNLLGGQTAGTQRWLVLLGDFTAESGGNTGSDFGIWGYNDAGNAITANLNINRATKAMTSNGDYSASGSITAGNGLYVVNGTISAQNGGITATGSVNVAGNINTSSTITCTGDMSSSGSIHANGGGIYAQGWGSPNVGVLFFGNASTHYLYGDQSSHTLSLNGFSTFGSSGCNFSTATITTTGNISATGNVDATASLIARGGVVYLNAATTAYLQYTSSNFYMLSPGVGTLACLSNGVVQLMSGMQCRMGSGGGYGGNSFNQYWNGANMFNYVDNSNLGAFAYVSDYRIKKDVIDLPGMWDTVKALRPIKYTQAQFSPPSHVEYVAGLAAKAKAMKDVTEHPVIPGELFLADDVERWGFIAHELQATLTPSASTGEKDSPDTIQSPNPFTLIAALTKALQEAMARIEALEAA